MSVITEYRQSPNYSQGRPAGPPTSITIHHWGADGQTHDGVVAYLCRENGNTSAHYVASAGRVTELVNPDDRAWHAGAAGNSRSIGIECHPECSPDDIATVAVLVAELRSRYGDLPLVPHSHWLPTACPGRWAAHLSRLDALARGSAAPTTRIEEEMYILIKSPNRVHAIVGPGLALRLNSEEQLNVAVAHLPIRYADHLSDREYDVLFDMHTSGTIDSKATAASLARIKEAVA